MSRTIDPKPCNPRTLQKPKKGGGYPKVFLGGLPSNVTETDLRTFFTRFGKVMEVVIMYDQEKKKSRGLSTNVVFTCNKNGQNIFVLSAVRSSVCQVSNHIFKEHFTI